MQNFLLYLITTLIWGSTWFAIKFQLGVVPPELSVAYRFFLAAVILFIISAWRGLPLRFTLRQHGFIALQGLLLFSLNYILVYVAEGFLTSGLVAVTFSTIIIFNVLFGAIFLKSRIRIQVLLGAVIGIIGLGIIFWSELSDMEVVGNQVIGLTLAVIGSVSASLGNIVSARNQQTSLPVIQTNAYGMVYGASFMLVFAISRGADSLIRFVWRLRFFAALFSIIRIGCGLQQLSHSSWTCGTRSRCLCNCVISRYCPATFGFV